MTWPGRWAIRLSPPKPSLVPLVAEQAFCAAMQGLSLRNVAVRVKNGKGKTVWAEQGELLFTHFGLSGPLILTASAHMRDFEDRSLLHSAGYEAGAG